LLELLDLSVEELSHDVLLHSLDGFLLAHEEVLEFEILALAEGKPLFFAELIQLGLPLFEESPGLLLAIELILHLIIVGQRRQGTAEVNTILLSFFNLFLHF
jgi:hypothetical protein